MPLDAALPPTLGLILLAMTPSSLPGASLAHEKYVLDNGMTVILHEDHALPIAAVNIWYAVGSKDESPGRSGFAHLFEHLMFMGTERVPGSQFDVLMERGGGSNNATTSYDRTNYFSSGPSSLLPTLLWLEADRMEDLGRMMTQEKLDKQRDVVRNERRQSYENRPYGRADLLVDEAVFPPGHPYHIPVIGSHEDLQAATVADVQQFFSTFYVASNASLVVAGDFDPVAIKPLIASLFGTLPARPVPAHAKAPPPVTLDRVTRLVVSDAVQLNRVTMAWPGPAAYAPGDADMDVLAAVLAQGKSSRLWTRLVRDERLCADVSAWQASRMLGSVFEIAATCPPESDLDRVETIVDEELARLAADGPTATEIERVRNQIEHAMLARLEGVQERADQLNAYQNARGAPDSLAWDLARYAAVTPATARRQARATLRPQGRVIVRVLTRGPRDEQPAPIPSRPFAFPRPETFQTAAGLTVHVWNRPQLPLVAAKLVLAEGASTDPAAKAGLTQLALDMLDEGTTRRSAPEFALALEQLGAGLSIQAQRENSTISLRSTRSTFAQAFGLLAEAITQPAMAPAEWQRVLALHRQELQQRDDDPTQVAALAASRRLFGAEHPFGRPVDGHLATVEGITLDAVTARLAGLVRPRGATLLLAGDITRQDAEALVAEKLGAWANASGDPPSAAPLPIGPAADRPLEVFLVHRPGAVQTVIRFAWSAPKLSDGDRVALELLNTILGGSFTSRLNQNLREAHGYTYGAGSRFILFPSTGIATAQSSVRADVTGAAIGEFLKELDGIVAGGITAEERGKAAATVHNRRVDATSGLDGVLAQAEEVLMAGLEFADVDRALAALAAVTAPALDELAARRVRHRSGVLVLVGDRDVVLPQLAGLGLPAPILVDAAGETVR